MNLIDCIWEDSHHSNLPSSNIYSKLNEQFIKKIHTKSPQSIEEIISECKSELDFVQRFRKYFQWTVPPCDSYNEFKKSAETSTSFRERANLSYKTGNVSKALRGYNLSIAFAPVGSPELGLAFGNRSALFLQINKPRLALRDITLAFQNNFPPNLSDRLLQRQEKCMKMLQSESSEEIKNNREEKDFCEENFFKLKNPHKNIPNAENWVDVLFEVDRGRKLVTTKDIPAGTLILIDKPWVSLINNLLLWNLQYCHFCSQPIMNGIPCALCTFTFYCDEECKAQSCEGSHKYEHNYLPILYSMEPSITHKDIMAMRIIGILGPAQLELFMKQSELLNPTGKTKGFDNNEIYSSTSYLPIYHLISHNSKDPQETLTQVLKSLLFTRLLKESTDFFQQGTNQDLEDFVASLIFKHISNIKYNAISITHLKRTAAGTELSLAYATALYPLLSLCNHSCDPNAVPVKKFKHLETSLVTLKTLKAGDELFITYKPLFTHMKTSERQEHLRINYQFACACPPCLNNWSIKSIKQSDYSVEKGAGNTAQVKELSKYETLLHESDDEIKRGNYLKAIKILKPCLQHFTQKLNNQDEMNYFPSLNSLTQVSFELYKRALLRIIYKAQDFHSLYL